MKKPATLLGITCLVILLILVRLFENELFYDPLINFYRYGGHLSMQLPQINFLKLLVFLSLRFWLNTLISLGIIFMIFRSTSMMRFATILFTILFIIGFTAFSFFYLTLNEQNVMTLFYIRRFLIHPIFILILLPAFYYYRLQKYKNP